MIRKAGITILKVAYSQGKATYCPWEHRSLENRIMTRENHPVWTVYDKFRTARLNVKYYGRRLNALERLNLGMEFFLLATAPSFAIAGLGFWDTEYGKIVWAGMGVAAAIAAVLKPLLNLTKRIKDYESVLTGYRTLEYDLMELKILIEQKGRYDQAMQTEFKKALQREKTLVVKNPESRESQKIKQICEAEVRRELPPNSFFIPENE